MEFFLIIATLFFTILNVFSIIATWYLAIVSFISHRITLNVAILLYRTIVTLYYGSLLLPQRTKGVIATYYLTIHNCKFIYCNSEKEKKSHNCEIFFLRLQVRNLDTITHNCEFMSHNSEGEKKSKMWDYKLYHQHNLTEKSNWNMNFIIS